MSVEIVLYGFEITVILSWHEYVQRTTVQSCGYHPLRPLEQALLCKLEHHENTTVAFTETELEIMCGWMNRVVCSKYGSAASLFGYERRAYTKLKAREGVRAL